MTYELTKQSEFMTNPSMRGHFSAQETFKLAMEVYDKYAVDDIRKLFFETVVKDTNSWHYWCVGLSNKYISNVRYVIRRVGDVPFTTLLCYHVNHSSMLKDDLHRVLEVLSYLYDKEDFQDYYARIYVSYGMKRYDALVRLDKYINRLISDDKVIKEFVEKLEKLGDKESESNE